MSEKVILRFSGVNLWDLVFLAKFFPDFITARPKSINYKKDAFTFLFFIVLYTKNRKPWSLKGFIFYFIDF